MRRLQFVGLFCYPVYLSQCDIPPMANFCCAPWQQCTVIPSFDDICFPTSNEDRGVDLISDVTGIHSMDFVIDIFLQEEEKSMRVMWWKSTQCIQGGVDVFWSFVPLRVFRILDAFLVNDCSFQHLITPYFHTTDEITMLTTRKS